MKILRKGDKFQKRKETTDDDIRAIKELVGAGWSYCDKQTWRREVRDKGKNVEEG
jgi:hypothetical protein